MVFKKYYARISIDFNLCFPLRFPPQQFISKKHCNFERIDSYLIKLISHSSYI